MAAKRMILDDLDMGFAHRTDGPDQPGTSATPANGTVRAERRSRLTNGYTMNWRVWIVEKPASSPLKPRPIRAGVRQALNTSG